MPEYLPFDPHPRAPRPLPPPRACDSQFHVFGPPHRYPVRPGAAYTMPTATWQVAQTLHATLGIERGVIVQATTYGADHAVVLDALEGLNAGGQRNYRGCANAAVLLEGDDAISTYTFNTGVAKHFFCKHCGVKSYYAPRSNPDGYSLNLNCMDRAQFSSIEIRPFDGRNWEKNAGALAHLSKE